MSIKAMNMVFESVMEPDKKIVMLVLADYADDSGFCFPSQETIAARSSLKLRTLQRRLKELVDEGWITREHRYIGNRRTSDGYRLGAKLAGIQYMPKSDQYVAAVAVNNEPPVRTTSKEKRATRISEDFTPTEDMRQWAGEKFPLIDIELETENFVDYWLSKPGKDGLKLDWDRTWKTWIRNAKPRGHGNVTPIRPGVVPPEPYVSPTKGMTIEERRVYYAEETERERIRLEEMSRNATPTFGRPFDD